MTAWRGRAWIPTLQRPLSWNLPIRASPGLASFAASTYADYVAVVEADSPEDAAQLAADEPEAYHWEYQQTAEFDARMYVTLDDNGDEIDGTEVDDS